MTNEYYIGLDLGTNSVGYAVTDPFYRIQRFNRKNMWGARLFEEGQTSAERRTFRSSRRRLERKKQRIAILQEIFAEEIAKVDPQFFLRLKESKYYYDDKKLKSKYTLFDDETYTDQNYYTMYPSIYHLRKELIHDDSKKDIRLYYLALHHILKHRGHFLFQGQQFDQGNVFDAAIQNLSVYLYDHFEFELPLNRLEDFRQTISSDLSIRDKSNRLADISNTKNKQLKAILGTMIGSKVKLSVLFNNEEYNEADKKDIDFKTASFDEEYEQYAQILNEDIELLNYLKAIYDWMVLSRILGEHKYLSDAKVADYEMHQEDLKNLKYLVKKYGKKGAVNRLFNSHQVKDNYASYTRNTLFNGKKRAEKYTTQEDVNKFFEKELLTYDVDKEDASLIENILIRLKNKEALPKLRTSDNGVIPYQVHQLELEQILNNASQHYSFLSEKDDQALTPVDKIKKTMLFRIPYYIGPLNPAHSEENGGKGNAWVVRKQEGPVLPWNYDQMIDEEKSAEKFIRRMTNKCTYINGADVLPKQSILYEKFKVLNELNNLKINGKAITIELKKTIYHDLFLVETKVTQKKVKAYLKSNGWNSDVELTGIDGDFKSSMRTYLQFKKVLGDKINFEPYTSMAETIVLWRSLFDEGGKIYRRKLKKEFSDILSTEELKQISRMKFGGWARLSKEFLTEVKGVSKQTGEIFSNILQALEDTNDNLMEVLSSKYTFNQEIERINQVDEKIDRITYDSVMKDTYISAPVKRTVWQTIKICEEIRKIKNAPPSHIFLEMTRNPDRKKERKDSRRQDLIKLYKNTKEEVQQFVTELESYEDRQLRQKALYLYYLQKGRSAYTGKPIDLQSILSNQGQGLAYYDIDHIYPRSLTKDDSFDNLVLVEKEVNASKSDGIIDESIRKKMSGFWYTLYQQGFMTKKKYERLMRRDELTPEELAGFISRQLVETSQATKAVADILQKVYPTTKIVYVKSRVVSDFRHQYDLLKIREMNDFHHAHDAYLNIVAGNAYYRKFTDTPYVFIKNKMDAGERRFYNLDKFFERPVTDRKGQVVWDQSRDLLTVKEAITKRAVNITRMPVTNRGELFDQQPVRKNDGKRLLAPLKSSDDRLMDTSRYGGYNKIKGAYFFVVEHIQRKKKVRTIEQVFIMYEATIKNNNDLIKYSEEVLGLVEPKIVVPKLKTNSLIILNGYRYYIQGRFSGDRIRMSSAQNIVLSRDLKAIFEKMVRMLKKADEKQLDGILETEWMNLYDTYIKIYKESVYKFRINNPLSVLETGRDKFVKLNSIAKAQTLLNIHSSFNRTSLSGVDLVSIGGKKYNSVITIGKNITNMNIILINQSVTGLFENKKVLNKV